jgi:hypothetical protein
VTALLGGVGAGFLAATGAALGGLIAVIHKT